MTRRLLINLAIGLIAIIGLQLLIDRLEPLFRIYIWQPDFAIIVIVMIGQTFGRRWSTLAGFTFGFVQDLGTSFVGVNALSKSTGGFLAGFFEFNPVYNVIRYVYALLSTSLMHQIIFYTVAEYGQQSFWELIFTRMIPTSIYTIIVGFLLYLVTDSMMKRYYESRKTRTY